MLVLGLHTYCSGTCCAQHRGTRAQEYCSGTCCVQHQGTRAQEGTQPALPLSHKNLFLPACHHAGVGCCERGLRAIYARLRTSAHVYAVYAVYAVLCALRPLEERLAAGVAASELPHGGYGRP
eukprot:364786-Chlamydomonas_euryale.AAC.1